MLYDTILFSGHAAADRPPGKGEEKNMMFARVFSLASNVGFWIGIVRIAVLNRSGFLMFFYITGAMLSYTAMVFAMPHKKEQISRQQA